MFDRVAAITFFFIQIALCGYVLYCLRGMY